MFKVLEISQLLSDFTILKMYEKATSNQDIFYDIFYLHINSVHEDGLTKIALFIIDDDIKVLFPFVERNYGKYKDIITPYEYGGILNLSNNNNYYNDFDLKFNDYCEKSCIITSFERLNPFYNFKSESKIFNRENIVIDLNLNEDELLLSYHKNNRRDIRYAERQEVRIEIEEPSKKNLQDFKDIYIKAMNLKNANSLYFFSDAYFDELLKLNKNLLIVSAFSSDNVLVSAAMFLFKANYSHYHLSANDREFSKLCANNLIIHKAANVLKKYGCKFLHLGGASKEQIGLYNFKSKFSEKRISYYIEKRIFNNYLYNKLITELSNKNNQKLENLGFPAYRFLNNKQ